MLGVDNRSSRLMMEPDAEDKISQSPALGYDDVSFSKAREGSRASKSGPGKEPAKASKAKRHLWRSKQLEGQYEEEGILLSMTSSSRS